MMALPSGIVDRIIVHVEWHQQRAIPVYPDPLGSDTILNKPAGARYLARGSKEVDGKGSVGGLYTTD